MTRPAFSMPSTLPCPRCGKPVGDLSNRIPCDCTTAEHAVEKTTPRQRVLRAVDDRALSWNRRSVRFWTSEDDYRLATRAERKAVDELAQEGVIRRFMAGGYSYVQRGGFERVPTKEALNVEQ